jgi:hypothetical protein
VLLNTLPAINLLLQSGAAERAAATELLLLNGAVGHAAGYRLAATK